MITFWKFLEVLVDTSDLGKGVRLIRKECCGQEQGGLAPPGVKDLKGHKVRHKVRSEVRLSQPLY